MKHLALLFLACLATPAAAQTTRLSGSVRDSAGQFIAGLTLHFYKRNGAAFDHLTVATGANGTWSIELPPGEWRGAAQTDDLLARGYFCGPGLPVCVDEQGAITDCGGAAGDWPQLWGPGIIDWRWWGPGIPGGFDLTIIPTRPELSSEKPRTSEAGVKVSFESTTAPMSVIRQWRIEKSTDLATWRPLQTVALSGASPVVVPDPDSATTPVCYYRAVQVEDVVVLQ